MPRLVKDGVFITLVRMAVPMLAGTFAMNAYNLTDAWFLSRLGTNALAAMSFTFPVVMLLGFVMRGLGTGAMTQVAHALGRGKHRTAARITTHAFFLSASIAACLTVVGLITIRPLFSGLGASGEVLTLTAQYMSVWYCGLIIRVTNSIFADIIIGTGSSKTVSFLIVAGTVVNCILNPLFIFGVWLFPRLGMRGSALATVIAELFVLVSAFYCIHFRHRLIVWSSHTYARVLISWRHILRLGIPSAFSAVLTPVSAAIVVKIVSDFGHAAVAACGVATRIEMFAFMIPMTVGMSVVPFVAQNYGAKRFDRILTARRGLMTFAIIYGTIIAGVFFCCVRPLAGLFSTEPDVVNILVQYICITCFGYGFLEVNRYASFCMSGVQRPIVSVCLNLVRVFVLMVPLTVCGAHLLGITGVFWGRFITDVSAAVISVLVTNRILKRIQT